MKHGQQLRVLREPYSISCCLPNPRYDLAGGDRVTRRSCARRPRDPGAGDVRALGPPRAGRTGGRGTAVAVHGRTQLMEESDRRRRRRPARLSSPVARGAASPLCSHGSSPAAIPDFARNTAIVSWSCNPYLRGCGGYRRAGDRQRAGSNRAQIGCAWALSDSRVRRDALDAWIREISDSVDRRADPLTVVVDALDESTDAVGVVRSVLQRVNPPGASRMRLIVGVRSVDDRAERRGCAGPRRADGRSARRASVAVDDDDYWEADDLRTDSRALTSAPSPYAGDDACSGDRRGDRGRRRALYLLAKLVAGELASRAERIGPMTPSSGSFCRRVRRGLRQELIAGFAVRGAR